MPKHVQTMLAPLLVALAFAAAGCETIKTLRPAGEPFRVGVTPLYRPLVYKEGARVTGLEADFARQLAGKLGRPLQLVELRLDQQIPSLLAGEIDAVMSGMTITDDRKVRVAFSRPYLNTGLAAMFRREDADKFDSRKVLLAGTVRVGYKKGTTAERFVQEQFTHATKRGYLLPNDAVLDLRRNRLDVFIHDCPAVAWLVSENESEVTVLKTMLTDDQLGWAFRPRDKDLIRAANELLAESEANGRLKRTIALWIPYRELFMKDFMPSF